eukprot:57148_1
MIHSNYYEAINSTSSNVINRSSASYTLHILQVIQIHILLHLKQIHICLIDMGIMNTQQRNIKDNFSITTITGTYSQLSTHSYILHNNDKSSNHTHTHTFAKQHKDDNEHIGIIYKYIILNQKHNYHHHM